MMRSFLLTLFVLFLGAFGVSAQTVLTGKVKDAESGEDLIGATIKVLRGTDIVRGSVTNYDGEYRFSLDAGTYALEVSYTGYQTERTNGVQVLTGQLNYVDVKLSAGAVIGGGQDVVVIKSYKVPLIEKDKTSGGQTLTSETIKNLPTRNVNAIVASTAGTTSIDGGGVNIKGSRSNATNTYIDGIRVTGAPPPVQDIEQIQVITGGLGAEFGDVTGGVISIVTKGPASAYHGSAEVENSHGLDPYGWLLATANVSGPLARRKKADGTKVALIGFRLSGQYLSQKDEDPPALKVASAKPEVIAQLNEHPLARYNGFVIPAAELLTRKDVNYTSYRPNEENKDIDFTGKLDFRISDNMDFQLTGTYKDTKDKNTVTGSGGWDDNNWLLLNSQNNPTDPSSRWRTIGRFRHRLGGEASAEATKTRKVAVSNAYYQIQFGFERENTKRESPIHQDKLFDYGYVGNFGFNYVPVGGFVADATGGKFQQVDTREQYTGYTAASTNAALNKYNEFANTDAGNYDDVLLVAKNGRFGSVYNSIWSGMHRNINYFFNLNEKKENDVLTAQASSGFDLKIGNTGTHNIQFGLLHEQRTNRKYSIAPFTLWELAYQKANAHINGLDTTKILGKFWDPNFSPFTGDSLDYFENTIVDLKDQKFYKKVREANNVDLHDYINVHGLTPDQLRLDMFGASELFNFTDLGLDYYGYDYKGNKLASGVTFDDFFKATDADGIRSFPIAAFQPLYQAAFIKDKFSFKDMILSLGLRAERFDLNTKTLKDNYSLYEITSADEYFRNVPQAGTRPASIGDNFKVYVNSKSDLSPRAYRDGDTWYSKSGVQQNDGNLILGQSVVEPLLKDTIVGDDILDQRFDPNTAFKDYDPQIVWLPRMAFSFPISDNANFFAHYDVLVQRPPGRWEVSPLDYVLFYIPTRRSEANANLKPEKVVDYEVGFQQKLNNYSALKFSAYYKEFRDMIQLQTYNYIPTIGSYTTYGNQDFGTTKGFTVQYDLRRISNFQALLAYTLQFADGTGSTDESQRELVKLGNVRSLFPLDFDERHNIQGIFDYRFENGKGYNGPRVAGKDILADFGVNVQVSAASGRPFTAKDTPRRFEATGTGGAINGSRKPWRTNFDMRVDKSFDLAKPGSKNSLSVTVYLRVANLLNRKNIIEVNGFTNSPTDDGYLVTQQGASTIPKDIARREAFLASYSWSLLDPNRFTQPRRIYVGAAFSF